VTEDGETDRHESGAISSFNNTAIYLLVFAFDPIACRLIEK
jgi:hypothetical protein